MKTHFHNIRYFSLLKRYVHKACQLGPYGTAKRVTDRTSNALYEYQLRTLVACNYATSSWKSIAKKHALPAFDIYWQTSISHIKKLHTYSLFSYLDQEQLTSDAQKYIKGNNILLGAQLTNAVVTPWHTDTRLLHEHSNTDATFNPNLFYKDIIITNNSEKELAKDIKIPWEFSRFYFTPLLAYLYTQQHNDLYAQKSIDDILDWIDKNPYLKGPNWVCPMEIGIRSINWIWTLSYLHDTKYLSIENAEKIVCSLYDHMRYLESHWEYYDGITSNHYLSDLVGYLYLCYFFKDFSGVPEKTVWCHTEIMKEWRKQITSEGTSYERTTTYHRLVTELFYHARSICSLLSVSLPQDLELRWHRMCTFIADVSYAPNQLIQIGDNDSGTIMYGGLPHAFIMQETMPAAHQLPYLDYPSFGLTIIKDDAWHISMRHHVYYGMEPTSHLHNDALSITVSYNEQPIIVDPGSYLYTASGYWRNMFRSTTMHNTFYIKNEEFTPFDERLFALTVPLAQPNTDIHLDGSSTVIESSHELYARYNIKAQRTLIHNNQKNSIDIIDQWLPTAHRTPKNIQTCWQFMLHPSITIERKNDSFVLHTKKGDQFLCKSSLSLKRAETWFSPSYGIKEKTYALIAEKPLVFHKGIHTTITKL